MGVPSTQLGGLLANSREFDTLVELANVLRKWTECRLQRSKKDAFSGLQ
jgi:hypothetical protein